MRQSRAQTLNAGLIVLGAAALAIGTYFVTRSRRRALRKRAPAVVYDYSGRSGFPRPAEQMRGAARVKRELSPSAPA